MAAWYSARLRCDSVCPRVYDAWQQCLIQGTSLDRSIADEIAAAMKDWAIEKGATHYTHWFQPMTGYHR